MRLVNRFVTLLLAAVLLLGGALLVVEVIAVALRQPPVLIDRIGWYRALTATRLRDPQPRTAAIVLALLGLLILVGQLWRWAPDRLPTRLAVGWHLHRRSVELRLATVVARVPGVVGATRVRVRRAGPAWLVSVRTAADDAARSAIVAALRRELDRLGAAPVERLALRLRRPRAGRRSRPTGVRAPERRPTDAAPGASGVPGRAGG